MKNMKPPLCWDDLYIYFDAADLHDYGALNLWNVINHMFDENKIIYADHVKEAAIVAGQWVDDWMSSDSNQRKLMDWNDSQGPFFVPLLSDEDWKSLGNVADEVIHFLNSTLRYRRALMLSEIPPKSGKPQGLLSACHENSVENWLGK